MDSTRVLGVRVDRVDTASALERLSSWVDSSRTHLVATVNPEFVMRARSDPAFAAVLESAELCLPDGWGILWAARRSGFPLRERVTGTDLLAALARLCALNGWRLFFLGGGPGVGERAATRLEEAIPGLRIAGVHAGSPDPSGDAAALQAIHAARPHILAVAYGAPRQEFWIHRLRDRLGVPIAIGVGGALDFLAGEVPRAPGWMRQAGFEWLYRLAVQPWRWRRMAVLPLYALAVLTHPA